MVCRAADLCLGSRELKLAGVGWLVGFERRPADRLLLRRKLPSPQARPEAHRRAVGEALAATTTGVAEIGLTDLPVNLKPLLEARIKLLISIYADDAAWARIVSPSGSATICTSRY
jgi:hypothetical protein